MEAMRQGSGDVLFCAAVLLVAVSSFLEGAVAVQHVVGGEVSKWSFLHANNKASFYNDWAQNVTLKTGDSLLFQYNNATHSVLQLATEAEFTACTVPKTPVDKWVTGNDAVFISKAGTYYFICGTPVHCNQGMKFTIAATGDFVAAPPRPVGAPGPGQTANHAAPTAVFSGAPSLLLSLLLIATTFVTL